MQGEHSTTQSITITLITLVVLAVALVLVLAGCGSSTSGDVAVTQPGQQVAAGPGAPPQPDPQPQTGTIVINHTLARTIPANVTHLRFTGQDGEGSGVYGPVTRPKAAEIILTEVPVAVVGLRIEYLDNGIAVGVCEQDVVVPPGGTLAIEEPPWTPLVGTVLVNHTLYRAITTFVTDLRITGFDAQDTVRFGPEEVPKAAQVTLENVPSLVIRIRLEYLADGVVIGTFEAPVQIVAGGTVTLQDPSWVDAPAAVGGFDASIAYGQEGKPAIVAAGDFDEDTRADVAHVCEMGNTLWVRSGNGDGTFGIPISSGAGAIPTSLAVSDFNGDGRDDVAVSNLWSYDVSVLLNTRLAP